MNKKQHIIRSMGNAVLNISKLNGEVSGIQGLTGEKIKYFLNNIANFEDVNYLEIGVANGATLTATLFNNNVKSAYAIEINPTVKNQILSYKKRLNIDFKLFIEDSFKLDLNKIKDKINVYFYDGDHSYESHYKALEYFYPVLDDEFIFMVDNWLDKDDQYFKDWEHVSKATRNAIKDLNLKNQYEHHFPRAYGWHGGFWVALLTK